MPRACTICNHERRADIEAAILEGIPNRRIASHHDVTERAVRYHKEHHLPAHLARSKEAGEIANADGLLPQVRDLQSRTLSILEGAESSGERRIALSAIREARSNLELLGKLAGELQSNTTVNVHLSAEWVELRAVIISALEGFPEARESVLTALESADNG